MKYSFGLNPATFSELEKLDTLISDGASNRMSLTSIPVFYGLLKETQKYEEQMGIDNSEIAEKHGKKYAVSAKSVEDYYYMLLRHAGKLEHGSVAVSYTHLDVYKRQAPASFFFLFRD